MKIIQLSTFYKPSVGGVERQVEEIYQHLTSNGFKVRIFTTDASHSLDKRLTISTEEEGVKRFKYLFGFGYFFRFSLSLIWNLLSEDFDLIHVHNAHDAHLLFAIIIKILRRKKLVLTGHNPFVVDKAKRGSLLSFLVSFYDLVLRLFAFGIDKYLALLQSEKEYVHKHFGIANNRIEVIPNGIRDIYFEKVKELVPDNIFVKKYNLDKKKWNLVVGCLCRMDYVKGIQNLFVAAKNNADCLFIFAGGDGGYLENLTNHFKDLDNVFFTKEYIDVSESLEFYAFIDIFLLPSIYEPFGITLVEAMTQGKYILATSHGGPKEIITEEFGEILDPLDFDSWSLSINKIKNNKNEYITKGKNGITASKIYRWDNVIDKLITAYKSI